MKQMIHRLLFGQSSFGLRIASMALLALGTLLAGSCRTTFSDKQFLFYDPGVDKSVRRVERKFTGEDFMVGIVPGNAYITEGKSFSVPALLRETRLLEGCSELKNIDIEFYSEFYVLIGMPKAIVRADCIR